MITFQSDAAGDVMMFDDVARRMMEIMGKEHTQRGVITAAQLPECIARLKAAIARDRAAGRPPDDDEAAEGESAPRVSLAQRALPLVELLERSRQRGKPVLWGI